MSGLPKRARPPNLESISKSLMYDPPTEFPKELQSKIFLCDRNAINLDDFRENLKNTPILEPFPEYDPPYGKDLYYDKNDRQALHDERVSEIARLGELKKRKDYIKEYKKIYDKAKEDFEEEKKSVQAGRSNKSNVKDVQKIFENSKNMNLSSSDVDSNSNISYSDDNDDSSDNNDRYRSSDSDEPRERKRKPQEKSHQKTSKHKSDRKNDSYDDSPKKKSKNEPDKERNYQLVIKGKVSIIPFIQDVYNQQKFLLEKLIQMNSNNKSEETQRKIKEQENRVNAVHKILIEKSTMPESPSMVPQNSIKPEEIRKHELYQRKLVLANQEIEKDKNSNIPQNKIESSSLRENAIDQSFDVFNSSGGSDSSDSNDDDILKEL